jgi:hypothetical protein
MQLHGPYNQRDGVHFRDEQVEINRSRISKQGCYIHAASYSDP